MSHEAKAKLAIIHFISTKIYAVTRNKSSAGFYFFHQRSDTVLQTLKEELGYNQPPYTTWNLRCFEMPKEKNTELFLNFLFFLSTLKSDIALITFVTLLQSK